MKRFVVLSGIVVVLVVVVFLTFDRGPRVDVSDSVPLANDALLILVNEYDFDFNRTYESLEEIEALEPGACAQSLVFETIEDCVQSWQARRFNFTTEEGEGFLGYVIMENESEASRLLNVTLTRALDEEARIPVLRFDTSGLAGTSRGTLGADLDELVTMLVRDEDGYRTLTELRMGRIVLVAFETHAQGTIDRRFYRTTSIAQHERIISYYNLSYDDL